jgi:hypothetical protein
MNRVAPHGIKLPAPIGCGACGYGPNEKSRVDRERPKKPHPIQSPDNFARRLATTGPVLLIGGQVVVPWA